MNTPAWLRAGDSARTARAIRVSFLIFLGLLSAIGRSWGIGKRSPGEPVGKWCHVTLAPLGGKSIFHRAEFQPFRLCGADVVGTSLPVFRRGTVAPVREEDRSRPPRR